MKKRSDFWRSKKKEEEDDDKERKEKKREISNQRHIQRERESSTLQANLLRTSCSSPIFSFRVLVDGAELLLLPAKEKIP